MNFISYYIIPLILCVVCAAILFSRRDLFDGFIRGARGGLACSLRLLPTLVALVAAVSMFSASGLADALSSLLSPLCAALGIPPEIVPLLAVRPVSGSASTAAAAELFGRIGSDSFAARCAAVIMGSSDTLVYVITI
ncbi:MAG: nucleoside recognition domain-containing protein, partial [Eubacteriales bacterium]